MALFQKYNNEDLIVRAVLAGLLDVLNNHIRYDQVWGNEDIEEINVPWFYNQSGDERFMQDFYTFYAHCLPPRPVDGNFDMVPRGVITYTGSPISTTSITSRYVQGRYVKEIDGRLESFVSFLYSIPLNLAIDCEVWADTYVTALKIEQEIRETFYRTLTYYVYYKGLRVGCTVGFPESATITKNITYSFETNNKIKLTFALEVESYQPVFDKTTEMPATSIIKGIAYDIYPGKTGKTPPTINSISPSPGSTLPKGVPIWIEWNFTNEIYTFNSVDISYSIGGERTYIDRGQPNNEYYIWNIPENFTTFPSPTVIWEETASISVGRSPIVKVVPDTSTGVIDSSSFMVFSEGYFLTSNEDASIGIILEMKDLDGRTYYSPDGRIYANVKWNRIDPQDPIVVTPGPSIIFTDPIDFKEIELRISNTSNEDSYVDIKNIKIV